MGKGLDIVLDAFETVRKRGGDSGTVFFAEAPGERHDIFLTRLGKLEPGQGRYRYLGRVADEMLMALYQKCFAVLLTSRFEGFGFPVLVAVDAGSPVVCSNAGALPEVAGGEALLFPSGDAAAFAARLERLPADSLLPDRWKDAGRIRGHTFSWDRCGGEMLGILRSVCAGSKSGKPKCSFLGAEAG